MTTVRYFAGAAAAAQVPEQEITLPTAATLAELTVHLGKDNPHLQQVLAVSTILIDGAPVRDPAQNIGSAELIEVLPPFAGG